MEEYPDNNWYQTHLGIIAASMGDTLRARQAQEWQKRLDHPYVRSGGFDNRAMIAAHLGELDEAIRLLRLAIQRGFWQVYLGGPYWKPLWGHPGFDDLIRPKG